MRNHCVLIIDDDPGAVEAFVAMLESRGYSVRAAFDAESGMREIEHGAPSAIIVDLHLPTLSGIDLLRRLRSAPRHAAVPVAVITGDYLLDHRVSVELELLGARLFFKPLWEDDLVRIAETLLNGSPLMVREELVKEAID